MLYGLYQPVLIGSYTLVSPQTVPVHTSSTTTVGYYGTITTSGAGILYVYIVSMPSYATASISINGIKISLVSGFNRIPIPAGTEIGPITLSNSNSTYVADVSLWAFIMGSE